MDPSIVQQINQALNQSKNTLIAFPRDYDADTLSSALALVLFLRKIGKNAAVACDKFSPSKKASFLPGIDSVQGQLALTRKFIISLDVSQAKVGELSYGLRDGKLNIAIIPKNGSFSAADVSSSAEDFPYDLIVTVGATDTDKLGKIYSDNGEFFQSAPILNIDRRPENAKFGRLNLIEPSFSSIAEIVFKLIGMIDFEAIDERIATCLLTGIISKNAFRPTPAEPQTLIAASRLMAKGGKKEEIADNICRYQPIPILKIGGLALARLSGQPPEPESPDQSQIIWSLLKKEDLLRFQGASEEKMEQITEELIREIAWAEIIVLLYEKSSDNFLEKLSDDPAEDLNNIHGIAKTKGDVSALEAMKYFHPRGTAGSAKFGLRDADFAHAEKTVLGEMKKNLNGEN